MTDFLFFYCILENNALNSGLIMLFNYATFIGIDPTAGQKPFSYAALDPDLRLLALGEGRMDDILAFTAGQRVAVAAVCAPRRPNKGLMARQDIRQRLSPTPAPGRWMDFRLVEYLLRQRNITMPQTPAEEQSCPKWMLMGFSLYRHLVEMGYATYPNTEAGLQLLEIYPHASYTALLGVIPFQKYSLEGRIQRQLALFENKVKVTDPMQFFEEITRHRLLKGVLPLDLLYKPGELDALVAAFTAWLTAHRPDQITSLGDPVEGEIILPVADLKSTYE
jgi:hypothetical protein